MVLKKVPERRCVICYESKPKKDLIRIVKPKDEGVSVDLTGKKAGRGAYICNSLECLEKAEKSNRFAKVFETEVDKKIYLELRDLIGSK
ncbi:MAG: YlxR family protein [Clostridia bacterium]|nr:YlxR family protein [Clostridia bacterium]